MKRTVFAGLFLTTALLASPVFAADEDLCGANITTLENAQVSSSTNLSKETKDEMAKTVKAAKAAQSANDHKKCIALTTKEITELKNPGSSTDGGGTK